jgi:hypothetical protein
MVPFTVPLHPHPPSTNTRMGVRTHARAEEPSSDPGPTNLLLLFLDQLLLLCLQLARPALQLALARRPPARRASRHGTPPAGRV